MKECLQCLRRCYVWWDAEGMSMTCMVRSSRFTEEQLTYLLLPVVLLTQLAGWCTMSCITIIENAWRRTQTQDADAGRRTQHAGRRTQDAECRVQLIARCRGSMVRTHINALLINFTPHLTFYPPRHQVINTCTRDRLIPLIFAHVLIQDSNDASFSFHAYSQHIKV